MPGEVATGIFGGLGILCVGIPLFLCCLIGAAVGGPKKRAAEGFLLGLLLGPLGIIVVACLSYNYKHFCPDCGSGVLASARRCPACRCRLA